MAGPSVAVRVIGDMSGLGKAFQSAGATAAAAGDKIKSAIGGALSTLNQTGILGPFGGAVQGAMDALDKLSQHGKDTGAKLAGAGGIMAGVGLGLQAVASKEQASHQQLQQAVENTGASYEDYAGKVDSAIKHQEGFGNSADKTQDALRVLTQATHDPQKALDLMGTAADVAAAKHEDLTTAAGQVGKVFNGNTKLLKEYGIAIDKTTGLTKDGKTATEALAQVTGGQAAAAADTFTGKLNEMKAKIEDSAAAFAQKYGPAITVAGTAMTGLGAAWQVATGLKEALTVATEAGTVADDAAAVSEGVALAPILLIIVAVGVLGAAIYELVTHWSTVWGAMKDAVAVVWDWIRANWPLLLAIILGPVAVAALEISKHWQEIKDGAGAAVQWIKDRFNDVVGFFTGLGGRIAGAVSGMWDGIFNAFRSVINEVINLWNKLHFTLPHIDLGPLGSIGGGDIGVPHINPLASGGIVTRPTLALVGEAGPEAVIPLGRAGALGPAVHIEHAYFQDQTDLDLLMKRAAWAARTARV
jgi:hypothetical protein